VKRVQAKVKLLKDIGKAIKEAREAGISDPVVIIKKALNSRTRYKSWKVSKTK
jgi:hypothetical protein